MITQEQYKHWKPLIEEYEQYEFQQKTLESMYCSSCQALEEHDCFCDEDERCKYCKEYGEHLWDCIYAGYDE